MGQLTEQYIRVRAKPFIVEVNEQEQKMFVQLLFSAHCSRRFFLEKPIQLWKKGVLYQFEEFSKEFSFFDMK